MENFLTHLPCIYNLWWPAAPCFLDLHPITYRREESTWALGQVMKQAAQALGLQNVLQRQTSHSSNLIFIMIPTRTRLSSS